MTPDERAGVAESMVPVAAELAWLVRDEGREAIGEWLDRHGVIAGARITEATRAFLVVLAAMVAADASAEDLLSWVTWDERGRPLDGTAPLFPALPVPADEDEHGSYRRYKQHRRDGESNQDAEECGCAQAARDYRNDRYARAKAKADGPEPGQDQAARETGRAA